MKCAGGSSPDLGDPTSTQTRLQRVSHASGGPGSNQLQLVSFGEALSIFERLGAVTWVDRARDETGLVGPRRRAPDELTAAELRVAELAATGITNREIARTAFMSEKTVEVHLGRVYRKLRIRSRAGLGARMAGNP